MKLLIGIIDILISLMVLNWVVRLVRRISVATFEHIGGFVWGVSTSFCWGFFWMWVSIFTLTDAIDEADSTGIESDTAVVFGMLASVIMLICLGILFIATGVGFINR